MSNKHASDLERVSRRVFLSVGSTALATGFLSAAATAESQTNARVFHNTRTSDPGPTNSSLVAQNPDSTAPPLTDVALYRHSNIHFRWLTSDFIKGVGLAR